MRIFFIMFLMIFINNYNSYSIVFRHDVDSTQYENLAKQKQFHCVGQILEIANKNAPLDKWKLKANNIDSLYLRGSCVLISDRYILSAAHCVTELITKDTTYIINDSIKFNTYITLGEYQRPCNEFKFKFNNRIYEADTIILHPGYFTKNPEGQLKNYDFCLIKLKEPVKDIKSIELYSKEDEIGNRAIGVGWGGYGGAYEDVLQVGKLHAGENMIDTIWSYRDSFPAELVCDFDSPLDKSCNRCGKPEPLPLEFFISGGDSGGGLFIESENKWYLAGISPTGGIDVEKFKKNGYYGNTFYYVRISVVKKWITDKMQELSNK